MGRRSNDQVDSKDKFKSIRFETESQL